MSEAALISDALAGGAAGGGGGFIGGFMLSRFLNQRQASASTDLGARIDRTNELLQALTVEVAEMKGILSAKD